MTDTQLQLAAFDCAQGEKTACERVGFTWGYAVETSSGILKHIEKAQSDCANGIASGCSDFAQRLFIEGKFKDPQIFDHFAKGCDGGDGWACSRLGEINGYLGDYAAEGYDAYYTAQGTACEAGDYSACTTHARLNAVLKTVRPDRNIWLEQLKPACDANVYRACALLSYILSEDGIDEEYGRLAPDLRPRARQAVHYARKACDGGNPVGCWNAGLQYDWGEGVREDWYTANTYYAKACKGGYAWGCEELNYEAYWELGDPMPELRAACKIGDFNACLFAAERDHAPIVSGTLEGSDLRRMTSYSESMREVCEMGSHKACGYAAHVLKNTHGEPDLAKRYATAACNLGDGNACVILGALIEDEPGDESRYKRALSLYEKACNMDTWSGCNDAGNLYHSGKGVPKDNGRAQYFFDLACTNGLTLGCENLNIALE